MSLYFGLLNPQVFSSNPSFQQRGESLAQILEGEERAFPEVCLQSQDQDLLHILREILSEIKSQRELILPSDSSIGTFFLGNVAVIKIAEAEAALRQAAWKIANLVGLQSLVNPSGIGVVAFSKPFLKKEMQQVFDEYEELDQRLGFELFGSNQVELDTKTLQLLDPSFYTHTFLPCSYERFVIGETLDETKGKPSTFDIARLALLFAVVGARDQKPEDLMLTKEGRLLCVDLDEIMPENVGEYPHLHLPLFVQYEKELKQPLKLDEFQTLKELVLSWDIDQVIQVVRNFHVPVLSYPDWENIKLSTEEKNESSSISSSDEEGENWWEEESSDEEDFSSDEKKQQSNLENIRVEDEEETNFTLGLKDKNDYYPPRDIAEGDSLFSKAQIRALQERLLNLQTFFASKEEEIITPEEILQAADPYCGKEKEEVEMLQRTRSLSFSSSSGEAASSSPIPIHVRGKQLERLPEGLFAAVGASAMLESPETPNTERDSLDSVRRRGETPSGSVQSPSSRRRLSPYVTNGASPTPRSQNTTPSSPSSSAFRSLSHPN